MSVNCNIAIYGKGLEQHSNYQCVISQVNMMMEQHCSKLGGTLRLDQEPSFLLCSKFSSCLVKVPLQQTNYLIRRLTNFTIFRHQFYIHSYYTLFITHPITHVHPRSIN